MMGKSMPNKILIAENPQKGRYHMANIITITLEQKKVTDNKVLFEEPVVGKFDVAKIGKVYIPKLLLSEIPYKGEGKIKMEIAVEGKAGVICKPCEPTKNCAVFEEILPDEYTPERIGKVYLPKTTIPMLGWEEGQNIAIRVTK